MDFFREATKGSWLTFVATATTPAQPGVSVSSMVVFILYRGSVSVIVQNPKGYHIIPDLHGV